MNKKGWIRIVESFVAILLIASFLLILLNKGYFGENNNDPKIYSAQLAVLREISSDNELRQLIIEVEETPLKWENFESNGLNKLKEKINQRIPDYLVCEAKICAPEQKCSFDNTNIEKSIYAQSILISATVEDYNPKQLKLFCWSK